MRSKLYAAMVASFLAMLTVRPVLSVPVDRWPTADLSTDPYYFYVLEATVGAGANECFRFQAGSTGVACTTTPSEVTALPVKNGVHFVKEVVCFTLATAAGWDSGDNVTMRVQGIVAAGTETLIGSTFTVSDTDIALGTFTKTINANHTFSAQGLQLKMTAVNQDTNTDAVWKLVCAVHLR